MCFGVFLPKLSQFQHWKYTDFVNVFHPLNVEIFNTPCIQIKVHSLGYINHLQNDF